MCGKFSILYRDTLYIDAVVYCYIWMWLKFWTKFYPSSVTLVQLKTLTIRQYKLLLEHFVGWLQRYCMTLLTGLISISVCTYVLVCRLWRKRRCPCLVMCSPMAWSCLKFLNKNCLFPILLTWKFLVRLWKERYISFEHFMHVSPSWMHPCNLHYTHYLYMLYMTCDHEDSSIIICTGIVIYNNIMLLRCIFKWYARKMYYLPCRPQIFLTSLSPIFVI